MMVEAAGVEPAHYQQPRTLTPTIYNIFTTLPYPGPTLDQEVAGPSYTLVYTVSLSATDHYF